MYPECVMSCGPQDAFEGGLYLMCWINLDLCVVGNEYVPWLTLKTPFF